MGGESDLYALLMTISRAHEFEADQFGALYAYRAGFNPSDAVTLHEVMLKAMGEIPRGMTHPTHAERIARVRDYLLDLRAKVRGFDQAVKALNGGDYDAAQAKLEVFLGVFPDSLAARSNLGVALHRKALSALEPSTRFRRSTDVDPNSRARKIELRAGEVNARRAQAGAEDRRAHDQRGDGRVSGGALHRSQLRLRAGEPRRRARRSEGSQGRARRARESGAHGAAVEGGVEQSRRRRRRDGRHAARARSVRQGDRARRRLPRRVVQPRHDLRAGGQAQKTRPRPGKNMYSSTARAAGPTSQSSTGRDCNRIQFRRAISRCARPVNSRLRRRCAPNRPSICASPPSRPKARAGRARSKRSRARSRPASNGRVAMHVYLGGIAGDDVEMGRRMRKDQLDGALSAGMLCQDGRARRSPSFAFRGCLQDRAESSYVMTRLFPLLREQAAAHGMRLLTTGSLGSDVVLSRVPIDSMETLRSAQAVGLGSRSDVGRRGHARDGAATRCRCPSTKPGARTKRAAPTASSPSRAPSSASSGSRDGSYMSQLPFAPLHGCAVMSAAAYERLPTDVRDVIETASVKFGLRISETTRAQDEELLGGLFAKQGVRSVPVSPRAARAVPRRCARRARSPRRPDRADRSAAQSAIVPRRLPQHAALI